MSRNADITLPLGTEERLFRLGLGQMRAVEEKCDAGLPELAGRLGPIAGLARLSGVDPAIRSRALFEAAIGGQLGRWRVDDYREVILQGLIGGGQSQTMAGVIVRATVDEMPPLESAAIAFQIVMAALLGPEDEPSLGETQGATASRPAKPRSRARKPAGDPSMAPAR